MCKQVFFGEHACNIAGEGIYEVKGSVDIFCVLVFWGFCVLEGFALGILFISGSFQA